MNLKTIYNNITENTHGVSPVVATLVLIVVAIIGAAAVGAMTGAFTEDVGGEEVDIGITGGSLIIAGSAHMEPVAKELAEGFKVTNSGVRITVNVNEDMFAGVGAVGIDVVDIGMISRTPRPADFETHPGIVNRVVQIGNSTVVLIGHPSITQTQLNNITRFELFDLFVNDTITASLAARGVTRGVFNMDRSGTGDAFAHAVIGLGRDGQTRATHERIHAYPNNNVSFEHGNEGVFEMIRTTHGAIGGIEIGFVTADVLASTTRRNTRPFNMITDGAPSRLEQAFLDYARSPGAIEHFRRVGVQSIVQEIDS